MKNLAWAIFSMIIAFMIFCALNSHKTSSLSCDRTINKCEIISRAAVFGKKVTIFLPDELLGAEIKQQHTSSRYWYYYTNIKTTKGNGLLNIISDNDRMTFKDQLMVNEINQFVTNPAQNNLNIEVKN